MITNLPIKQLYAHPDNPRKNLGDLTEFAESIKARGVMQNLTVVPQKDGTRFTVIIGHRRLAAAKLAGLTELPCAITAMSDKDQVATMLLENMQRSDLTVYEQAKGIQMMIDLGETVSGISEKTGFSESTVRRRVNLLDLDAEKFKKSVERGATLMDFAKLDDIKDPGRKEKVLEVMGTVNFQYELKRAKDQERDAENIAKLKVELDSFATLIEESATQGLKYISWVPLSGFQKPDDAGQRAYFYTEGSYYIRLYAEKTEEEQSESEARDVIQAAQKEREKHLDEISERAFQLRYDFVKGLTGLKKKLPVIHEMLINSLLLTGYGFDFDTSEFAELMDLECDDEDEFDMSAVADALSSSSERVILIAAYANFGDGDRRRPYNWQGKYERNEYLDLLYGYLERLGYAKSDEECQWLDGSHELYKVDEDGAVDSGKDDDTDEVE